LSGRTNPTNHVKVNYGRGNMTNLCWQFLIRCFYTSDWQRDL